MLSGTPAALSSARISLVRGASSTLFMLIRELKDAIDVAWPPRFIGVARFVSPRFRKAAISSRSTLFESSASNVHHSTRRAWSLMSCAFFFMRVRTTRQSCGVAREQAEPVVSQ